MLTFVEGLLLNLAVTHSAEIQQAVLENPNVPELALRHLEAHGKSPDISQDAKAARDRLAAARDSATSPTDLQDMADKSPSRELARALMRNPATPAAAVMALGLRDAIVEPEELLAMHDRVLAEGLSQDQVAALIEPSDLSPAGARELAGWLVMSDAAFRTKFAVDGQMPVAIALEPTRRGLDPNQRTYFEPVVQQARETLLEQETLSTPHALDALRRPASDVSVHPMGAGAITMRDGVTQIPAMIHTVEVGGHQVEVRMPQDPSMVGSMPTLEDVTRSLRLMPEEMLAAIPAVTVVPEFWDDGTSTRRDIAAEVFRRENLPPGRQEGEIMIYAQRGSFNPRDFDITMLHEGAHSLAGKSRDANGVALDKQSQWQTAIEDDGNRPSRYPRTAHRYNADPQKEDFAETVTLYLLGRDQPGIAQRFEHRFAVLDDVFGVTP